MLLFIGLVITCVLGVIFFVGYASIDAKKRRELDELDSTPPPFLRDKPRRKPRAPRARDRGHSRLEVVGAIAAAAIAAVAFALALSGCAHAPSPLTPAYQTGLGTVTSLDTSLNAAIDADGVYQNTIATDGTLSSAQRHDKLASYRAARAQAIAIVQDVRSVVDAGPSIFQLAEDGVKKLADVDKWISDSETALEQMAGVLVSFGLVKQLVPKKGALDMAQIAAIVSGTISGASAITTGILGIVSAVKTMGLASTSDSDRAAALQAAVKQFDDDVAALATRLGAHDSAADALAGAQ